MRAAIKEHPWRVGLEPCGDVEYELDASCVEGKLPAALLGGTLYRCGPGRIRVGGHRYAHWFDGDGCVSSLSFSPLGTLRVVSRLVETPRLRAQRAQGDDDAGFAVRGAWTQATQPLRNLFAIPTNPSNTSMLRWANKLLALCEGGSPMELDATTLQTLKPVSFSRDPTMLGFGAHFKIDPQSNVLFNCGLQLPGALRIFSVAPDGTETASASVSFGRGEIAFVHDWAMTENYMILFIPPWVTKPLETLQSVVGLRALAHTFSWQPDRGTRCLVLRKSDFAVVLDTEVDAFSTYHFANAWEEGPLSLKVHVNRLNGDRTALEKQFSNMYAACFAPQHYNSLWQYTIDLQAGNVSAAPALPASSGALPMEYPMISHRRTGLKHRYVYTTAYSGGNTFFDTLQKCDMQLGTTQTRRCPSGEYPSEVAFVPSDEADAPEDAGFLIFIAYVAASHTSKVYVLDAADFEGAPLAVCSLPVHVPYNFHGWFEKAARSAGQ